MGKRTVAVNTGAGGLILLQCTPAVAEPQDYLAEIERLESVAIDATWFAERFDLGSLLLAERRPADLEVELWMDLSARSRWSARLPLGRLESRVRSLRQVSFDSPEQDHDVGEQDVGISPERQVELLRLLRIFELGR